MPQLRQMCLPRAVNIHFVKDDNDPGPYKYFRRFYAVAGLMRVLYRVRDKCDVKNVNV